ncbi:MAG: hypothetical protein ABEN55_18975, partial [Bradymonadaceae bacterium]
GWSRVAGLRGGRFDVLGEGEKTFWIETRRGILWRRASEERWRRPTVGGDDGLPKHADGPLFDVAEVGGKLYGSAPNGLYRRAVDEGPWAKVEIPGLITGTFRLPPYGLSKASGRLWGVVDPHAYSKFDGIIPWLSFSRDGGETWHNVKEMYSGDFYLVADGHIFVSRDRDPGEGYPLMSRPVEVSESSWRTTQVDFVPNGFFTAGEQVYVVAERRAEMWRTGDGGKTWTEVTPEGLQAPILDTAGTEPTYGLDAHGRVGVLVDDGPTWKPLPRFSPNYRRTRERTIDEHEGGEFPWNTLVMHDGALHAATRHAGILRWTPQSRTWSHAGPTGHAFPYHLFESVGDQLWAGNYRVHQFGGGSKGWTAWQLRDDPVGAPTVVEDVEGAKLIGTNTGTIVRSTDGGRTWTATERSLGELRPKGVRVDVDGGEISALASVGDVVYAGMKGGWTDARAQGYVPLKGRQAPYGGGLFRSDDGGETWQYVGDAFPTRTSESRDGETAWRAPATVAAILAAGETFFLQTHENVYRRRAGAERWRPAADGFPATDDGETILPDDMAVLEDTPVAFIKTDGATSPIYVWRRARQMWKPVDIDLPSDELHEFGPLLPAGDTLYLSDYGRVYALGNPVVDDPPIETRAVPQIPQTTSIERAAVTDEYIYALPFEGGVWRRPR